MPTARSVQGLDLYAVDLRVRPHGITISLSWAQIAALCHIIEQYNIELFVELGIHEGGMGSILFMRFLMGELAYIGVDNTPGYLVPMFKDLVSGTGKLGFIHKYADCFSDKVMNWVEDSISQFEGKALLFCDNGNKPKEILAYHNRIRPGDILVTHDYGTEVLESDLQFLYNHPDFIELEEGYYKKEFGLPAFIRAS